MKLLLKEYQVYKRLFWDKLVLQLEKDNVAICIGTFFHKALEVQVSFNKDFYQYFALIARWTRKQDHSGPELEIALGPLELEINIYDSRHWYYKENRWYEPGEEMRLHEERKAKKETNSNIELGEVSLLNDEYSDIQE